MNKVTAVCLQENMAFFYLNVTLLKEISGLQITDFPTSDKSKEIKVDMVIFLHLPFATYVENLIQRRPKCHLETGFPSLQEGNHTV